MRNKINKIFSGGLILMALMYVSILSGQNTPTNREGKVISEGNIVNSVDLISGRGKNKYFINGESVFQYQFDLVLERDAPELSKQFKRARIRGDWGKTLTGFSLGVLVVGGAALPGDLSRGLKISGAGGGALLMSLILWRTQYSKMHRIVDEFNKEHTTSMGFMISGDGVGLAWRF